MFHLVDLLCLRLLNKDASIGIPRVLDLSPNRNDFMVSLSDQTNQKASIFLTAKTLKKSNKVKNIASIATFFKLFFLQLSAFWISDQAWRLHPR